MTPPTTKPSCPHNNKQGFCQACANERNDGYNQKTKPKRNWICTIFGHSKGSETWRGFTNKKGTTISHLVSFFCRRCKQDVHTKWCYIK
jgi:hypothetical protein